MSCHTVEVVRTHIESALNEGNPMGWELTLSDDFTLHLACSDTDGNGYRSLAEAWSAIQPCATIELVNIVAHGERATVHYAVRDGGGAGSHPASAHFRVRDFEIVDAWIGVSPDW